MIGDPGETGGLGVSARLQNIDRSLAAMARETGELRVSWHPEDIQPLAD